MKLSDLFNKNVRTIREDVTSVVQFEIGLALRNCDFLSHYRITDHRTLGACLDLEEVTAQATEIFREQGIVEVIVVVQPILQLTKCRQLVKKHGFKVLPRKVR